MDDDRKKLLNSIIKEADKMVIDRSWPVTEEELVEHPAISNSYEFGFLCGFLHCKQQMMKDAMPRKVKFLDSISYNHCIAHLGMSEDDTVKLILVKEG